MTIEIIEVLRRSDQGITRPFICRGDDGETYFVKGLDAGRPSLICEWIVGRLAVLLDLPIAPFEIVEVPEELLELDCALDLSELGVGPAFASCERQVTELTVSVIDQIPNKLQQDVLVFDWWVKNGDRCLTEQGGNPNLFWEPGCAELVVIDHNQAFNFDVKKQDFFESHVFRNQLCKFSSDLFRQNEYNTRFSAALNAWSQIVSEIPETWWFVDNEMTVPANFNVEAAYRLLKGFEQQDFWNWK
ncbi:MAG: HipA family kinase [Methylococcales bacterium]